MTKIMVAAGALALLASGMPASAKNRIDSSVAAALACGSIRTDDQRLRCFDQALVGLRQAVSDGHFVSVPDPKLEGVVKVAAAFGFNRAMVEMDNGDRWEIESNYTGEPVPRRGAKVRLKKGWIGNYMFLEEHSRGRRAKYRGRS